MGIPPDPRRAGRPRNHRGAIDGVADAQERRKRADAPPGRPGLGRVPRSWLYTQPDISSQIRRLRQSTNSAGSTGAIPVGQRTTDASLRARPTTALDRNKQLADENARLRRQLARALGDQRSALTRSGNDPEE
jgi:hypothetical protein